MRKILSMILAAALALALCGCAAAAEEAPVWQMTESIEMTEEAQAVFDSAAEDLTGAEYEPVALLGESEGVYCILCRVRGNDPEAKISYSLVYVGQDGVKNIWELWIEKHSIP